MPCSCSRTQNMLISSHRTNTCNIIWLGLCSDRLSTTHCTSGFLSALVTPLNMLSSQNPCIVFFFASMPTGSSALLHVFTASPCKIAAIATQDQCIILKEFDETLVILPPCALLVSCKLHFMLHFCRIMEMQAIQRTCGHAPKSYNNIWTENQHLHILVIWKVKNSIINLCFLHTFVIWAVVHIGICASKYPFRPLARLSTLWQSGIPPAQPNPAQPIILYINSRSSTTVNSF